MTDVFKLSDHPVHLGRDAGSTPQPIFTGEMSWYEAYGVRHDGDGKEGRLVAQHTFTSDWPTWEMHPLGSEVVLCLEGEIELIQKLEHDEQVAVTLRPGEYLINPPGVWHTGNVATEATVLFITAGLGTENVPR